MQKKYKLMQGNNIDLLKKLPDNSIDAIVSDPPYGLSFMNKKWDYDVPSVEFWREVWRVLKPGGHILSFGGTRTYHRMVVNIEDAGFEIRDQIQWLYGSGFPKSLNIGKAIDKLQGNEREVVGISAAQRLNKRTDAPSLDMNGRKVLETKGQSEWEGWGTALKPANEPICMARKPLSEKSVAENVLKWRTGGINVDACRIGSEGGTKRDGQSNKVSSTNPDLSPTKSLNRTGHGVVELNEGRFPANIILDEIAGQVLDEQSGISGGGKKSSGSPRKHSIWDSTKGKEVIMDSLDNYGDKGGASRFFYQAKVSKKERNMALDDFDDAERHYNISTAVSDAKNPVKNNHPTVKPIALMSYLCKLITPPNGIILDPFMGSGSTGIAALLNDYRFVGMEMDADYSKIAEARIENYEKYREFLK